MFKIWKPKQLKHTKDAFGALGFIRFTASSTTLLRLQRPWVESCHLQEIKPLCFSHLFMYGVWRPEVNIRRLSPSFLILSFGTGSHWIWSPLTQQDWLSPHTQGEDRELVPPWLPFSMGADVWPHIVMLVWKGLYWLGHLPNLSEIIFRNLN